jgi:hypothetical protein
MSIYFIKGIVMRIALLSLLLYSGSALAGNVNVGAAYNFAFKYDGQTLTNKDNKAHTNWVAKAGFDLNAEMGRFSLDSRVAVHPGGILGAPVTQTNPTGAQPGAWLDLESFAVSFPLSELSDQLRLTGGVLPALMGGFDAAHTDTVTTVHGNAIDRQFGHAAQLGVSMMDQEVLTLQVRQDSGVDVEDKNTAPTKNGHHLGDLQVQAQFAMMGITPRVAVRLNNDFNDMHLEFGAHAEMSGVSAYVDYLMSHTRAVAKTDDGRGENQAIVARLAYTVSSWELYGRVLHTSKGMKGSDDKDKVTAMSFGALHTADDSTLSHYVNLDYRSLGGKDLLNPANNTFGAERKDQNQLDILVGVVGTI